MCLSNCRWDVNVLSQCWHLRGLVWVWLDMCSSHSNWFGKVWEQTLQLWLSTEVSSCSVSMCHSSTRDDVKLIARNWQLKLLDWLLLDMWSSHSDWFRKFLAETPRATIVKDNWQSAPSSSNTFWLRIFYFQNNRIIDLLFLTLIH